MRLDFSRMKRAEVDEAKHQNGTRSDRKQDGQYACVRRYLLVNEPHCGKFGYLFLFSGFVAENCVFFLLFLLILGGRFLKEVFKEFLSFKLNNFPEQNNVNFKYSQLYFQWLTKKRKNPDHGLNILIFHMTPLFEFYLYENNDSTTFLLSSNNLFCGNIH